MNILIILLLNEVLGLIAFICWTLYCCERYNGKKYRPNEYRFAAYSVDCKIERWWRTKFGDIFGNVLGILIICALWYVYIPIHKRMIEKEIYNMQHP